MSNDFIRFLAAWALVHETADEGWKAAVSRGGEAGRGKGMEGGPEAFVDGLAAMVAEEKERLKEEIQKGTAHPASDSPADGGSMEEIRFEIGLIRARLETMETSLDKILKRLDEAGGRKAPSSSGEK